LPLHESVTATTAVRARGQFGIVVIELAFCPESGRLPPIGLEGEATPRDPRSRPRLELRRHEMSGYHITDGIRPQVLVEEIYSTRGSRRRLGLCCRACGWLVEAIGTRVSRGPRSGRDAQCRL
jgi:hypothetical protein